MMFQLCLISPRDTSKRRLLHLPGSRRGNCIFKQAELFIVNKRHGLVKTKRQEASENRFPDIRNVSQPGGVQHPGNVLQNQEIREVNYYREEDNLVWESG